MVGGIIGTLLGLLQGLPVAGPLLTSILKALGL